MRSVSTDKRPRLLDLFCGAGGAGMGYHRAGFDVTGVDIKPQSHYPFAFLQGDALEYVSAHGHEYDAIHASPPCQGYSTMRFLPWLSGRVYPRLIVPLRALLVKTGKPYVIENVATADELEGVLVCGRALGMNLSRHRRFESNIMILYPPCPGHDVMYPGGSNAMSQGGRRGGVMGVPPGITPHAAMGIDWMTLREMRQAIPPDYTEYVGRYLLEAVTRRE